MWDKRSVQEEKGHDAQHCQGRYHCTPVHGFLGPHAASSRSLKCTNAVPQPGNTTAAARSHAATALGDRGPPEACAYASPAWPWSASRERTRGGAARPGSPHPCRVRAPGRMTHTWILDVWAWMSMVQRPLV